MNLADMISSLLQGYGLLAAALLLLLAAGATALLALGGLARQAQVGRRLAAGVAAGAFAPTLNSERVASVQDWLSQIGRRFAGADGQEITGLRLRLHRADFTHKDAVFWFYGVRAVLAASLPLVALLIAGAFGNGVTSLGNFLIAASGGGIGFIGPSFLLDVRIRQLKNEFRIGFPDMLDLLVVCLEAGMSFEAGLDRINHEIGAAYPHLRNNITQLLLELRAGKERGAGLFAFADRLGLEEAASFANMIVQAEQLGSGIAQTLRVCADDMRDKRLLRAEEYAQALPIMLVVPLGAFIFPAILVVTLLPAGISIYETFISAPP